MRISDWSSDVCSSDLEDVMRAYRRALAELPDRTREVFLLHRVDELAYREIGEKLGISIPTVQYHVARALAHIDAPLARRSGDHTSELQSLMRKSYAVFRSKKNRREHHQTQETIAKRV